MTVLWISNSCHCHSTVYMLPCTTTIEILSGVLIQLDEHPDQHIDMAPNKAATIALRIWQITPLDWLLFVWSDRKRIRIQVPVRYQVTRNPWTRCNCLPGIYYLNRMWLLTSYVYLNKMQLTARNTWTRCDCLGLKKKQTKKLCLVSDQISKSGAVMQGFFWVFLQVFLGGGGLLTF